MSFNTCTHFLLLLLLCLIVITAVLSPAQAQDLTKKKALNNSVTAVFVFGDSTVDPGNNNYIRTPFKSNFPPYGRDFENQIPTGRFTNGRLATDFIVSYIGLKEYIPPYLDPTLSIEELTTGVSFASAGSGNDPLTPRISGVIQMSKQLEYFKEYKKRLEVVLGRTETEDHIKKAVFVVSAGTNDFVVNYFTFPVRRRSFTVSKYQELLMQNVQSFIQDLWELGARRIAVVGLPPMGCLPLVITLQSKNAFLQRGCIELYSSVARDYNQMLQIQVNSKQTLLATQGARIYYVDIYGPVMDLISRHQNLGIDVWDSGCCGTGLLEATFLCNPKSYVCPDASKYVFWDSIHPTETAYYVVFEALRPTIDLIIKD